VRLAVYLSHITCPEAGAVVVAAGPEARGAATDDIPAPSGLPKPETRKPETCGVFS